jgi:UrcA family protein
MSDDNRNRGTPTGLTAAPLIAALLCTTAFATTGVIAAAPTPDEVAVSYVRADLSEPKAARSLYKRIQAAARSVCHEPTYSLELTRYRIYRQCYERAVDAAVAKVDASALTALHRSRLQRSAAG